MKYMRILSVLVLAGCILRGAAAAAQFPITLTINPKSPGLAIPKDFSGLSFETEALRPDSAGVNGYLFDSTNTQLLMLFRNLGIRNLRIGGTSVDRNKLDYVPAKKDIDALFRFAKAADVKVIYSLRLLNGNSLQDAAAAKYVWDNYRKYLTCFAIGNEPNLYKDRDPEITNDASFYDKWKKFATVITNSVPGAKFGGPDTGTGGTSWASDFAKREADSGIVTYVFSHYYVGGAPKGDARHLINEMLSPTWDTVKFQAYYGKIGAIAVSLGFPYRLTEANSFVAGFPGIWGGNNSFASALFALDFMHWWAAHNCQGVHFHTFLGKYNGTIYVDANGNCQVYPIAYGIKAFDIGGHGTMDPVAITNPDGLNLTAYAVTDANNNLFVTVINKEHGRGARAASVLIAANGVAMHKIEAMFLTASNGDIGATSGITLGSAPITSDAPWSGKWTSLKPNKRGCVVLMPAASAAVVKISTR
jgi:hypothetical protein